MSDTRVDEQMIRSYLLGTLPAQDTERIDELIFTDDDIAERLRVVENELVDSYARGKLSGDVLSKFESHYLIAPGHQQKVKTAQALRIYFNQASEPETVPSKSKHEFPFRTWWLTAAAVIVIGLSSYLLFDNFQLRNQMFQKQAEVESLNQREDELQNQLNQQRAKISETEKELASVREKLAKIQEPIGPKPDIKQIAFYLFPPTRSASDTPVLPIPTATEFIIFNLKMEEDDFNSYRVKLKYIENPKPLWSSDQLQSKNHSLEVRMPVSVLNAQRNYLFEISGISTDGTEKILTGYPFKAIISD
jgi:hypothetical protein